MDVRVMLNNTLYGMDRVKEKILLFLNRKLRDPNSKGCNLALLGISGVGKCLAKNTPVILYDGNIKMSQYISTYP